MEDFMKDAIRDAVWSAYTDAYGHAKCKASQGKFNFKGSGKCEICGDGMTGSIVDCCVEYSKASFYLRDEDSGVNKLVYVYGLFGNKEHEIIPAHRQDCLRMAVRKMTKELEYIKRCA